MFKTVLFMLTFLTINFMMNIMYMKMFKEESTPIVINVNFDKDANGI